MEALLGIHCLLIAQPNACLYHEHQDGCAEISGSFHFFYNGGQTIIPFFLSNLIFPLVYLYLQLHYPKIESMFTGKSKFNRLLSE